MKYLIGNWKANKNLTEVEEWFKTFADLFNQKRPDWSNNLEVVICPPFVYLQKTSVLIKNYSLPIKLGAQDVAPFGNGPYTGEVIASQLSELVEYVIIGHSERRKNFGESDEILSEKVKQANAAGLKIIYCVPDDQTIIPKSISIVAYEPVWAIGSGKPETPTNASQVAKVIKNNPKVTAVIYGGSVKPDNVVSYLEAADISGVLPGGASLDPLQFWQIIVNASNTKA